MRVTVTNHYDPAVGAQLNERMQEAFGFTFQPWFELGLWDDRYESYAVMDNGKMRSNLCVFKVDLAIEGRRSLALQIGAVATEKEHRGKGHSRAVFDCLFGRYPGVPAFLHANASVTQFYPKMGFVRTWEWVPTLAAQIDNDIAPERVPMDDAAFLAALDARGPLSRALDCRNTGSVLRFHLIYGYGDAIYRLPALDAYVLAKQNGGRLLIADIISARPIPFDALHAQLPFRGVSELEFGFTPDLLGINPTWTRIEDDDEALFVRGDLPLPDRFRFPITSMT